MLTKIEILEYNDLLKTSMPKQIIKSYITEIYNKKSEIEKIEILIKYLYEINIKKIKITTEQINLSFQDIIYNSYEQIQIGYTGTIYMNLNIYEKTDDFVFRKKVEDYDEKIEIKLALNRYGSSKPSQILVINKTADIEEF